MSTRSKLGPRRRFVNLKYIVVLEYDKKVVGYDDDVKEEFSGGAMALFFFALFGGGVRAPGKPGLATWTCGPICKLF